MLTERRRWTARLSAGCAIARFRQHCSLFGQRPFVWHISDGVKDGFSVFVHYHRFDQAALRKLTYTLLGDWLARAEAENNALRYEKGRELQQVLEKILEGEKPYDIFVRWKSLTQQPLGWNPDLDDGVRQNIRPFILAGVLTHDLSKILKDKDRGKDVASAPWYDVFNGERRNQQPHHTGREARRARDCCETGGGGEVTTPLDALVSAVRDAASYNAAAEAPPEAVLWCDENQEFLPLLPALRERLPELLTYGDFDAATRTGPAVWLCAALAGAVSRIEIPEGVTPILYLPGVGRETLKSADDSPTLLQPLVWYTVAGTLFGHVNGKDWTLRGFLGSDRGPLKLGIAEDNATRAALAHAASRLCSRPVEDLRGKRWDADQLDALLAPDLAADMLDWIDGAFTEAGDSGRFAAFANIADKQLKFDPRKLAPQDAVRRLAKREGRWGDVWERFTASTGFETVATYLGLEEPGTLFEHSENRDSYPRLNAQGEKNLREALLSLADLSPETATKRIAELDEEHAWRRETVWARRGEAPLAMALSFIAKVAAAEPIPSHDGNALAEAYVTAGADADWAAMCALAAAPRDLDREAITAALRAVYLPWLDAGALSLQELIREW